MLQGNLEQQSLTVPAWLESRARPWNADSVSPEEPGLGAGRTPASHPLRLRASSASAAATAEGSRVEAALRGRARPAEGKFSSPPHPAVARLRQRDAEHLVGGPSPRSPIKPPAQLRSPEARPGRAGPGVMLRVPAQFHDCRHRQGPQAGATAQGWEQVQTH